MSVAPLRGVMPALVTPLTPDGAFDAAGCRRLVEHVLQGGVHGVLALGSTGEVTALETDVRQRVLVTVLEAVDGRVPVLVGVAQTSLSGVAEEIRQAAAMGARAAVVVPPFYTPIDQATTLAFYRRVAETAALPVLIYNIPGFTKVMVSPDVVARLAEEGAVLGIKDSSRDFEYFQQVVDATSSLPDFGAFIGTDTLLLPALLAGAAGAITLTANVAPAVSVRVYDAARAGLWEEAKEPQRRLLRLVLATRRGVFPAAAKAALSLLGVCGDTLAPPAMPLDNASHTQLASALRALRLLPENSVERVA